MSQNNYNTKIMQSLLRRQNHIRGLAKALGTNQTTIARKMEELYKANMVDYRKEGKNKVFFLKKTIEAKQYACITEMHRLLEALKRYPALRNILENIKKQQYQPCHTFWLICKRRSKQGQRYRYLYRHKRQEDKERDRGSEYKDKRQDRGI